MRLSLPRARVRIQHPDEPDAYPWWDFEIEDAAEIRACRKFPYAVKILDEAGRLVGDISNLVAGPWDRGHLPPHVGHPDTAVAYHAADCWAYSCGIEPGNLFRFLRDVHRVIGAEHISQGYGDIGYATGFLICQDTEGLPPMRVCIEHATDRVLELTAASSAPTQTDQSGSKEHDE
ncbi:hypothetical protein GCM10010306_103540 [Streptomyces umbrinus]|uniref:hypothetical protein n=1 Tax=Streptomyces umbrinus TaxID=67370 RepID=UPI00167526D7|nr:hypothetical protein [Streptomyces umbrinus]GHB91628.1 hypothetical protein GCM10010306_103540 [Streptomyces umbrinus]